MSQPALNISKSTLKPKQSLNGLMNWGKQRLGGIKSNIYDATVGHFYTT